MAMEPTELRAVVNSMARLLGEVTSHAANAGLFDGTDQEHLNDLLQTLLDDLRRAQIRGADHHLAEAQTVLRDRGEAPPQR